MQTRQNYGGLDAFRLVAAFLVIAIHTSPLTCFSANADFFLTRVLARVAVPFFFMVTGQFVVSRFYRDTNGWAALTKSLTKLSLLYLVAIALYVPIGLYGGHYEALSLGSALRLLLFDGTFYHLWYFPACLLGLCLVYLMSRKLSLRKSLAIALFLYLIGLMGDSYYGLARSIPVLDAFYQGGFQVFSYTRNGLFFAPIFLILGAWLSQKKTLERPKAIFGLCLSFAGMAALSLSSCAILAAAILPKGPHCRHLCLYPASGCHRAYQSGSKSTAFASLAGRSKPSSLFGRFRCILWRCVCPCIDSSAAPALFSQRAGLDRAGQPGLGSQHRLFAKPPAPLLQTDARCESQRLWAWSRTCL